MLTEVSIEKKPSFARKDHRWSYLPGQIMISKGMPLTGIQLMKWKANFPDRIN